MARKTMSKSFYLILSALVSLSSMGDAFTIINQTKKQFNVLLKESPEPANSILPAVILPIIETKISLYIASKSTTEIDLSPYKMTRGLSFEITEDCDIPGYYKAFGKKTLFVELSLSDLHENMRISPEASPVLNNWGLVLRPTPYRPLETPESISSFGYVPDFLDSKAIKGITVDAFPQKYLM